MTRHYSLEAVLLPTGWARDVLVTVSDTGRIDAIDIGAAATSVDPTEPQGVIQSTEPVSLERVSGIVVPGMPNAHSHAFQRGMTGNTEYRSSAQDSFWTWRTAMYVLANRIEPRDLEILATQLFIEMLKAGYTSVAEFHYLHRRPGGDFYPDGEGLWEAVIAAAQTAGIGLTLLPTLYQTSDFGGAALRTDQARFGLETEWFVRTIEKRIAAEQRSESTMVRTGAAFHSLRAVPLTTLRAATDLLRRIDPEMPLHIHVAEQIQEVESCLRATGRRPIELLLDTGLLDEHWCLVHATHATAGELEGIAASRAAVCVSISTEANLGDGLFDTADFLKRGGRLCIGSDSQITVSPAEELRWMEYQQRLSNKRRAVLADERQAHVGTHLWSEIARHGARGTRQPTGEISVGCRADWLVLDANHPYMAGSARDTALDHLVFAGGERAISDVMVGGRWVVKSGHHEAEMPLRHDFLELMSQLAT